MENEEVINGISRTSDKFPFDCKTICIRDNIKPNQLFWKTIGMDDREDAFKILDDGRIRWTYIEDNAVHIEIIDKDIPIEIRNKKPITHLEYLKICDKVKTKEIEV